MAWKIKRHSGIGVIKLLHDQIFMYLEVAI
jgi:hypothetical protein